jgi:hypothetical protein
MPIHTHVRNMRIVIHYIMCRSRCLGNADTRISYRYRYRKNLFIVFSSRMAVGLTAKRIHMAATQLGAPQQIRQRAHHHRTGLVSNISHPTALPARRSRTPSTFAAGQPLGRPAESMHA